MPGKYRELEHSYKGFLIWGNANNGRTGTSWTIEPPSQFSPDNEGQEIYYKIRNEQPELKTLKQAKKWIDEFGITLTK